MNTFTPAEHALLLQLLCEYRVNILRTLAHAPPKGALSPQSREQYAADARLAAEAITKLMDEREVA